jgi:hypothetical protein
MQHVEPQLQAENYEVMDDETTKMLAGSDQHTKRKSDTSS